MNDLESQDNSLTDYRSLKMQAQKEKDERNYVEAIKLYKELFEKYPDEIDTWDKVYYSWSLYYNNIKPAKDVTIAEDVELITELTSQSDNSAEDSACVYTLSVFKMLKVLKNSKIPTKWKDILYWSGKLNSDYLSNNTFKYTDYEGNKRETPSRKEEFYLLTTRALYESGEYYEAIRLSQEALEKIKEFRFNNDLWIKRTIALSFYAVGTYKTTIKYLKEVLKTKTDWYIKKELAEAYYKTGEINDALALAVDSALQYGTIDYKYQLYDFIAEMLRDKGLDSEAKLHNKLSYQIRVKNNWDIDDEELENLKSLDIDTTEVLDPIPLEQSLRVLWEDLKYESQEQLHGTITKILANGKSGFVTKKFSSENYYFNFYSYKGDPIEIRDGLPVSFYLEEGYNKKKKEKNWVAVNIKEEE
ncbi:MAG: hypothetical protein LBM96_06260 [Methanobrevibacter sp.]|jgi:tetratricopeptide (TPR) repeat protein|nr:hypothetical protein [Candidatus Methanoflexus mossambicus]